MYVLPKEASEYYGVSDNALRMWANDGRIKHITTKGGHRRYLLESKEPTDNNTTEEHQEHIRQKIIYSRVSSGKQRDDLKRQSEYLKSKYPDHRVISDIGSGINFKRTGFKRILEGIFKGTISEVVVAHKDRFTRFGYDLFEWIFQQHGAELICDKETTGDPKDELSEDLMAIITVFTARYHGKRKYKAEQLL
jgi:predicted site-specific integrase-resolvase